MLPIWTTACQDWEDRILAKRSLVPFGPLFPAEAERALTLFNDLVIVDAAGRPTMKQACLPWAFDLPNALFGSYDPETGKQLVRFFFEFVAKKNAKSTKAAAIMVTALALNWRDSGEFYILAPTKEIADNSFFPARDMVRADEGLRDIMQVQENFRTITHRNSKAFLKVVAADSETVGGKKTIGLLVDELWLFGKRANAEAMIREASGGLASRDEGFVIYLSTQSDQAPTGIFAQKLEEFRAIRDGKVIDPRSLPILYEFPKRLLESGEYRNPKNYYIPNPNLGASVSAEFIGDELTKSERAGRSSLINAEAKYLNVQVGINNRADSWVGVLVWERGIDKTLTLDSLLDRSEVVTVGIDGGGLEDLLGVAVIGREKVTKRWLAWAHALISDVGIERRKANIVDYDRFEQDGDLTKFVYVKPEDVTKIGTPINIRYIVDLVKRIKDRGLLAGVGVDKIGIGAIVDALAEIDVRQTDENSQLDSVSQGIALMGAIKTIEIKLADYSFCHGGSELLAWCVGNLRVIPTRTAMMVARDEAGFGKVDPFLALADAAQLMSMNPETPGISIFDHAEFWWDPTKPAAKDVEHVAVQPPN